MTSGPLEAARVVYRRRSAPAPPRDPQPFRVQPGAERVHGDAPRVSDREQPGGEREREAADEIARGNEAAQRVRAAADREVVEVTSEARKNAEIIRGEADATRNNVYAEAFGKDPEFFAFTRSLTAYERALQGGNSSIVLSPDSEFFNYLGGPGIGGAAAKEAAAAP